MAYLTMNRAADSCLFVEESMRLYKDTVQESLAAKWAARRPDEPVPRFDHLLEFFAADLGDSRAAMMKRLELYLNETKSDGTVLDDRNNTVTEVTELYRYFRDLCVPNYGPEETLAMGFDLAAERQPWRLARQTERALNFFKGFDPDEKILPKDPRKAETALRAGFVVDLLEGPHRRLVRLLETLVSERRNAEKTLIEKDRAFEEHKEKFTVYAKTGEMLYRWAGLDEEARRIKPSTRRPGQREETEDEPLEPPQDDAPAPDPAAEPASTEA